MSRIPLTLIALAAPALWAQTAPPPPVAMPAPAPMTAVPQPPQPQSQQPPAAQPPVVAQPPAVAQPPIPAVVQPAAPVPAPPPPAVARTPAPPAPPTAPVKGLPADAPKLVVNGGTYSERRDLRMAIVNGNVVREGANVDGVVVEQIQPDGVVLAYRGARYHVMY